MLYRIARFVSFSRVSNKINYVHVSIILSSIFCTDVIMDMLGNFKMRQIITENYQSSKEPKLVELAIRQARYAHSHTHT